eukprot:m.8789 g.8789  ORF g.8789 m.8789 type:complete len:873 (+) comp2565_c0_seq1:3653-6271(+)
MAPITVKSTFGDEHVGARLDQVDGKATHALSSALPLGTTSASASSAAGSGATGAAVSTDATSFNRWVGLRHGMRGVLHERYNPCEQLRLTRDRLTWSGDDANTSDSDSIGGDDGGGGNATTTGTIKTPTANGEAVVNGTLDGVIPVVLCGPESIHGTALLPTQQHASGYGRAQERAQSMGILSNPFEINDRSLMLATLQHKNLVMFYGAFVDPPLRGYVFERMDLGSLAHHIDGTNEPWLPAQLVQLAVDVAHGMEYIHEAHGIVHGNLTSHTVLLRRKHPQSLAASDVPFIAKVGGLHLLDRTVYGTMSSKADFSVHRDAWMAPEVLAGQQPTQPADSFSFAAILYHALTLRLPWALGPSDAGTTLAAQGTDEVHEDGKEDFEESHAKEQPNNDTVPSTTSTTHPFPFTKVSDLIKALDKARPLITPRDLERYSQADDTVVIGRFVDLIQLCWSLDPKDRPAFGRKHGRLKSVLERLAIMNFTSGDTRFTSPPSASATALSLPLSTTVSSVTLTGTTATSGCINSVTTSADRYRNPGVLVWSDVALAEDSHVLSNEGGVVRRGVLRDQHDVAVKMVSQRCRETAYDAHATMGPGGWTVESTGDHVSVEAETLADISHPNLLRFWGTGVHPDTTTTRFVVVELMEYSLSRLLWGDAVDAYELTWERDILHMAHDAAKGVKFIHASCGRVHGDLKSPNLLVKRRIAHDGADTDTDAVSKRFVTKIGDFGLTNALTGLRGPGTLEWRAPELHRRGSPTFQSDIYAVSIIMWECLTRRRPWDTITHRAMIGRLVTTWNRPKLDPIQPPLCDIVDSPGCDEYVELMRTCWRNDAALRPTAAEVVFKLDAIVRQCQAAGRAAPTMGDASQEVPGTSA